VARLAQDLNGVVNAGKYPETQTQTMAADAQAIFQANGSSRREAAAVSEAAKALSAEILHGAAK
jgi:hypothetical protein